MTHPAVASTGVDEFKLCMPWGFLSVAIGSSFYPGEAVLTDGTRTSDIFEAPTCVAELEEAVSEFASMVPFSLSQAVLVTNSRDFHILKSSIMNPDGFQAAKKVCECGATKVGSPFHSSWCPLEGP